MAAPRKKSQDPEVTVTDEVAKCPKCNGALEVIRSSVQKYYHRCVDCDATITLPFQPTGIPGQQQAPVSNVRSDFVSRSDPGHPSDV